MSSFQNWNEVSDFIIDKFIPGRTGGINAEKIRSGFLAITQKMAVGGIDPEVDALWKIDTIYPKDTQPVLWRDLWLVSNITNNEGIEPVTAQGVVNPTWRKIGNSSGGGITVWEAILYPNILEVVYYDTKLYYLDRTVVGIDPFLSSDFVTEEAAGKWKQIVPDGVYNIEDIIADLAGIVDEEDKIPATAVQRTPTSGGQFEIIPVSGEDTLFIKTDNEPVESSTKFLNSGKLYDFDKGNALILEDIAALGTANRKGKTVAIVKESVRGGTFNYVAEVDFVETEDNGISFTAQDGGYWVRAFTDKINIDWYDDGTLDAAVIQAANNSAASAKKTLFFPEKTYTISAVITITAKWKINEGAIFKAADSTDLSAITTGLFILGVSDLTVENLVIDCNTLNAAKIRCGIYSINKNNINIKNCKVIDTYQIGIQIRNGDRCVIDNNTVEYLSDQFLPADEGISLVGFNDFVLSNNHVIDGVDASMGVHVCEKGAVYGNTLENGFGSGPAFDLVGKCEDVCVYGNTFVAKKDSNTSSVVRIAIEVSALEENQGLSKNITFFGNTLRVLSTGNIGYGIRFQGLGSVNCFGNTIEIEDGGNLIMGCEILTAASATVTYTPNNIKINNNKFINYSFESGSFSTDFGADANQLDTTLTIADGVKVQLETTDTLPSPLKSGKTYYIVNSVAGVSVELALESGGTPVTLTDDGTGTHTIKYSNARLGFQTIISNIKGCDLSGNTFEGFDRGLRASGGNFIGKNNLELSFLAFDPAMNPSSLDFSVLRKIPFCLENRPVSNSPVYDLSYMGIGSLFYEAEVEGYIFALVGRVSAGVTGGNLNLVAKRDAGGGYASITGLTIQFVDGEADTLKSDIAFTNSPVKYFQNDFLKIETNVTAVLGSTVDIIGEIYVYEIKNLI